MLKGLEISELSVNKLERTLRIDAEFYSKKNLFVSKMMNEKNAKPLTDFVHVSDGNHLAISDYYCNSRGIPYYRGSDIYNFFIEQAPSPLYVKRTIFDSNNMKRSHLEKGDVLMSIVGAIIGNLSIVSTDNNATCSCKLAILRPKAIKPNFLAIFLKSLYGQNQIQKFKRGTAQTGLILEDFNQLLIPLFSPSFEERTSNLVQMSYRKLEQSKTLYKQSEEILLKELDLLDFEPSKENIAIKSFSESFGSSGRLDSEYYLPMYDEIEKTIEDNSQKTIIRNEFDHIKTKFDKSKEGYNYTEIGNVNVSDGSNISNYILTENLPANAKINVADGDLLISTVRPNRGAITIIHTDESDLIVSGAFTVLRKKENSKINTQVLQVLLRTNIYKELLLKYNVGTQYPVIKDDDVLNIVIPLINTTIQTKIEDKIKESFRLKEESKRLLEVAKRGVEVAVEEGENLAIQYIKEKSL